MGFIKTNLLKTIELTGSKDGNYPEKAIDLLNAVGKYFIDEDEITTSQVTQYIKEIENLSEATGSEERTIIFDDIFVENLAVLVL